MTTLYLREDQYERIGIHAVCIMGDLKGIEYFIVKDGMECHQNFAVNSAIKEGHIHVLEYFRGYDVNLTDIVSLDSLIYAVRNDDMQLLTYLFEEIKICPISHQLIAEAVDVDNLNSVKFLINLTYEKRPSISIMDRAYMLGGNVGQYFKNVYGELPDKTSTNENPTDDDDQRKQRTLEWCKTFLPGLDENLLSRLVDVVFGIMDVVEKKTNKPNNWNSFLCGMLPTQTTCDQTNSDRTVNESNIIHEAIKAAEELIASADKKETSSVNTEGTEQRKPRDTFNTPVPQSTQDTTVECQGAQCFCSKPLSSCECTERDRKRFTSCNTQSCNISDLLEKLEQYPDDTIFSSEKKQLCSKVNKLLDSICNADVLNNASDTKKVRILELRKQINDDWERLKRLNIV